MNFDDWSFQQCIILGHDIISIKDESGMNIKWINTTTKEEFIL